MKLSTSYLIFILLWVPFLEVKAQGLIYSPDIPVEQHRIVIDHALGGTVSEWFVELSYTPLETKNSRDVVNSVFKTGMIGNSIGILPNDSKKFYIYSTEGRLIKMVDIAKISGLPNSEGVHDMRVWGDCFVLSMTNYKVKMDNKGENILLLEEQFRYGTDSVQVGNLVWKYMRYDSLDNPTIALALNNNVVIGYSNDRAQFFFDKDTYFSPVSTPNGLSYFLPDNHYKIFELEESKINKVYDFIFPQHNLVDTSVVYNSYTDWAKKIIKQEEKIHAFDHVLRCGNYLIFKAGLYNFYGLDLFTKDFISFANIIPDQSNDYMEVFSNFPVLTDGEYLYTFMHSYSVQYSRNTCEEENHTMRKEYQDLLKQYNIILLRFKLKI
ncbi:hypothetical protein [Sphingobacterium faecale]|uniref:6-bladed beta-propeller n=1 Tax=Sphingobacterium faecale TaxID=2803775 RepID=A0ABS1QY38_9SPHI|nr:hypothetical protein [Sphingobacterium faecale]MBL1407346.1 hypothetical protein [Sphingobacterium faecale]